MKKIIVCILCSVIALSLISCGGLDQFSGASTPPPMDAAPVDAPPVDAPPVDALKVMVYGNILDSRGIPVDGASLYFSDVFEVNQTDSHGYFNVILPKENFVLKVKKDNRILKELNILTAADNNQINLGSIAIDNYFQPEIWPNVPIDPSYKNLVDAAIIKYRTERQDYTPYLMNFEPFGNFLNWSSPASFTEGERLTFDEFGFPKVKYGDIFYYNPVTISRYALYIHGRYLNNDSSLEDFLFVANKLIDMQDVDGAFRYEFKYINYANGEFFDPGWCSGMAQGLALSVFARAYQLTGQEKYLIAGTSALSFLSVPIASGGVLSELHDLHPSLQNYIAFEEYPASPATYTLNGYMFTLLGLYSWWQIDENDLSGSHKIAKDYFFKGIETLEKTLPYYDVGGFSVYDLGYMTYGIKPNLSTTYHKIHIFLLHALHSVTSSTVLKNFENLWSSYVQFEPVPPATGVELTSNISTSQPSGVKFTLTAVGQGGSGDYEYRYLLKTGTTWEIVKQYSTNAIWEWDTSGIQAGSYYVQVDVRSKWSQANREASKVCSFVLQ